MICAPCTSPYDVQNNYERIFMISRDAIHFARLGLRRSCLAWPVKFRPLSTTSERQLILALAASHRMVTLVELTAWRKDGLLPPLASNGLGTGKGRTYYWCEPGIVAQAQTVHDLLQRKGRGDAVILQLWLEGFPVALPQLRRAWRMRIKQRRAPVVRKGHAEQDNGFDIGAGAPNLLLKAALCLGAALDTGGARQASTLSLVLERALVRLGLAQRGENFPGGPAWTLLATTAAALEDSNLIADAGDDELQAAQRYVRVAMDFLADCAGACVRDLGDGLTLPLSLFILTLIHTGQTMTLDRIAALLTETGRQDNARPAQPLYAQA
jgi:hypothetical protein